MVPQITTLDTRNNAVTAPRWRKRYAAHSDAGYIKNRGYWLDGSAVGPLYPRRLIPKTRVSASAASEYRRRSHRGSGMVLQISIRAVTTRALTASPSHHVV